MYNGSFLACQRKWQFVKLRWVFFKITYFCYHQINKSLGNQQTVSIDTRSIAKLTCSLLWESNIEWVYLPILNKNGWHFDLMKTRNPYLLQTTVNKMQNHLFSASGSCSEVFLKICLQQPTTSGSSMETND